MALTLTFKLMLKTLAMGKMRACGDVGYGSDNG